jgi:Uma2 family endonuclease
MKFDAPPRSGRAVLYDQVSDGKILAKATTLAGFDKVGILTAVAALLQIPSIKNPIEFHLERWKAVCADPALRGLPEKIETNRFGHVVMMPPPGFSHSRKQSRIIQNLHALMSAGVVLGECAVLTTDGVKGLDAAWVSGARVAEGLRDDVLTVAPEICVEVVSPSNTRQEIEGKRQLYFEAGAQEVWVCDHQGEMHYFIKSQPGVEAKASVLCPKMPKQLED